MANSTHPADDPTSGYLLIIATQSGALLHHEGKCSHCESCVLKCPNDVLSVQFVFEKLYLVSTPSKCCGCFDCVPVCPTCALRQQ
ncbi:MAG: 4Fe-4S binding protein [Campylobacteraceae bacterium]|jgi:ferredoxin|nr:4Fe-4S binding protein [Campylobacteraceae bacterium]